MKESECIPYHQTGYFSTLILDYLNRDSGLQDFISQFPDIDAFQGQIEGRGTFPMHRREILVQTLKQQYEDADVSLSEAVSKNINLLQQENCFTVTTGHQLNILSGPLYFIYKILDAIKLSEQLKAKYPDQDFVPIYWMATEDHDFAEISIINLYGGKLRWHNDLKGAVGKMPTFGFGKVLDDLEEHLGPGNNAKEILGIFREAYHERKNLSDATRYFANALFQKFGLVILDGDSAELKQEMIPYFKEDLFSDRIHFQVKSQSDKLKENYFSQVYPREINLFYLKPGLRERIEKQGDEWQVLNSDIKFNREELNTELEQFPERFSPNVVLRPLYQECILPNLAYIGGGGEIAYWFQLKSMFDDQQVPFPLLMLRNSVLLIPEKWRNRLADLDLKVEGLFKDLEQVKADFIKERFPADTNLGVYEEKLEDMFEQLKEIAELTDKSMIGAVNAQRQKQLNGLAKLRKKLIRAEKRRLSEQMEKIERVFYELFPSGGLQERHDNLSQYYADHGYQIIDELHQKLDPLDFRFTLIHL